MMTFQVLALLREDGRPLIQQTEKVVLGTHAGLAFELEMAVLEYLDLGFLARAEMEVDDG